jgi:hypothetical protein
MSPVSPGSPVSTVSSVRVFAKSLHWLAAGWAVSVVLLCVAQIQRGWLLDPAAATDYHVSTLIEGLAPALIVEAMAFFSVAWSGPAPTASLERREWVHAFVWSLLPNVLTLYTVYLMVFGDL